jgi:hypothetical protein
VVAKGTALKERGGSMRSAILFRLVAFVFLLFAAGHTFGFLTFRPSTPDGLAVFDAMNRVHFTDSSHRSMSYGNWYTGFGLTISAALAFSAFLAWQLGSMAKRGSQDVRTLGWGFVAWQIPGVVLSFMYFGVPPMILGSLVTILIGFATAMADVTVQDVTLT